MSTATTTNTFAGAELLAVVSQFLALEARLLDEGKEEEWYELLDEELRYSIPIRMATEPRSKEIQPNAYRVLDTKRHIRTRLDRLHTGHAYAEVPPSRTMRVIGSIEVHTTSDPTIVTVASALLMYRQRGIDDHFDLVPCRRNDTLRLTPQGPLLLTREIILTETAVRTPNLGIFL